MEDFDNDGLLDLAVTAIDPTESMVLYRNTGDGTLRGPHRVGGRDRPARRPGLLPDRLRQRRPHGHLHRARGLAPVPDPADASCGTSATAPSPTSPRRPACSTRSTPTPSAWADYDNDGWLDLFIGCERQPNRLYHNRGDGTFEEVAVRAGVDGKGETWCKGCTWVDYDNDDYPDLFLNNLNGTGAALPQQPRRHTSPTSRSRMGIDGPTSGFACWTWDYDNDGWLDIFATCYDRCLDDVVRGMMGMPTERTIEPALSATSRARASRTSPSRPGSTWCFADHGLQLRRLRQRRLARHVPRHRRAQSSATWSPTGCSGTSTASGSPRSPRPRGPATSRRATEWPAETGTATATSTSSSRWAAPSTATSTTTCSSRTPGQGNHWLTVKLVGKKTNRAAIGARIKVVTAGEKPMTDPPPRLLGQQLRGKPAGADHRAGAGRPAWQRLEIRWPTSGTTQVFRDIAADRIIEVTEFAEGYRTLGRVSTKASGDR